MSLHILKSDWTTKDGKHWMNIGDGKEPYRASNRIPKEKEEKDHSDSERLKQLLDMRPVEVSGLSIDRLSRKEINLKAQNSFYKIQEQGISLSDGRKVVLTGRGLKKILSHSANEIVLHIIPRLKELIESSIYLFRETNNSKEKINIDYFESRSTKLSFGSRELFVRFVLIKEGNRVELLHYDHNLTDSSILNGAISPNPHQLTKPGEKEKLPTYDKLYQWAVNASKKTSNSNIQKSYSGESKMNQNIQKSTITQAVAATKRQLNFQNGLIDIFKARPIKYKFKIATGNPRRPYRYFYTEAEYKKYLDTSRATKKAKRDVKNQKPHTPSLVSSTPTEIGVGNETDVNNSSPKFELTQEKVSTPGERSVGSGPNLFGITERTESKYVNKNFQPEFNPSNDVNSIESLITEVKSQLLNAGLNDRAREWIEATYNTKSTMTNVFNLAYKFVRITGEVANSIRKQIIKASVNETKQQLFDPQVRKQLLESHGIDPETPVPRPNDIDIKNQKENLDQSTPKLPLKQQDNEGAVIPSSSHGLDSSGGEKSQGENPPIITDPATVQRFKNSIAEGESILQSGKSHGRKLSSEEMESIQKSVDNTKRRIGELPPSSDPVKRIQDFLRYINYDDTSNEAKSISLGKVNDTVAQRIKELTGIDVTGFHHKLSKYDVKHILNSHGGQAEKLRGQIPIEESDLELIPKIIGEPDQIEMERISHQGIPAVKYTKKIGTDFYVIEEVGKTKESLSIRTMYKRAGRREPMAISPQHLTSETFPPADSTIPESGGIGQEKNNSILDNPSVKNEINSIVQDVKAEIERRENEIRYLKKNAFSIGKPIRITKSGISGYIQSSEVENIGKKDKIDFRLKYSIRDNQGNIHEAWAEEIESQPILVPKQIAKTIQETTPETRSKANKDFAGVKPTKITRDDLAKMSVDVSFEPKKITISSPNLGELEANDYSGMSPEDIIPYDNKMNLVEVDRPKWMPNWDARYNRYRLDYVDIDYNGERRFLVKIETGAMNQLLKSENLILTQEQIIAIESFHFHKAKQIHKIYKEKRKAGEPIDNDIFKYSKNPVRAASNRLSTSQYIMISRKLFGKTSYQYKDNRLVFQHFQEMAEGMKYREIDLRLGFQDSYDASTYKKGVETSYGDSGVVTDLVDSKGVLVKMQNGKQVDPASLRDIQTALNDVYNAFGDRSSMAKKFGLKISHSGMKRMHASKAVGFFIPKMRAIGVSFTDGKENAGLTLAHEFGHFIDYYIGQKDLKKKESGRGDYRSLNYASTGYGIENQIATAFRGGMDSDKKSKEYWTRSTECFARALECYYLHKRELPHDKRDGYNPNKDYYNQNVLPLVEKFFDENHDILKSFFAVHYPREGNQKVKV